MDSENPIGEVIAGCIGDGAAGGFSAGSKNFGVSGVVRNGAGDYTVTHLDQAINAGGRRATPIGGATAHMMHVDPLTATTTKVLSFDAAGAAADSSFCFEMTQYYVPS